MSDLPPFDAETHLSLFVKDRISKQDADRQKLAAKEADARFARQPGLILADEVGMGKTFVALAVAAMRHFNDPQRRPVVVMVPPALAGKWPRDAAVFRDNCLQPPFRAAFKFNQEPIENGIEFLKTIDDEDSERKKAVVFITHGALHRSMSDNWVRLAILRRSMRGRHGSSEVRKALARFAGGLLRMARAVDEEAWDGLLDRDPAEWLGYLQRNFPESVPEDKDDPVPAHLWEALQGEAFVEELRAIYDTLEKIPKRHSSGLSDRLTDLRRDLKWQIEGVWRKLKGHLATRLPLLIFDEAHHLKNPQTQLVKSLFKGSGEDVGEMSGAFFGVFEKIMFLTATPFQLGHHELLNVLRLFDSVAWEKQIEGGVDRAGLAQNLLELEERLDEAQLAALRLDQAWSRLKREDLSIGEQVFPNEDAWWEALQSDGKSASAASLAVREQAKGTDVAMRAAETALRPWVMRHLRSRMIPNTDRPTPRRNSLPGQGIVSGERSEEGLPVDGGALLPFLLAARTVAITPGKRAVFAEGLASSYEAFLHTHGHQDVGEDEDEDVGAETPSDSRVSWYAEAIQKCLKAGEGGVIDKEHPKLGPTVDAAVRLWKQGEKVVIFCHYIQTGLALRKTISARIQAEIHELAGEKLKLTKGSAIDAHLEKAGDDFFEKDNPVRKRFDELTTALVREHGQKLDEVEVATVVEVVRRFFRTPAFLARYFPLDRKPTQDDVDASFMSKDASGETLGGIISRFVKFIGERCGLEERQAYLEALGSIQTGTHAAKTQLAGEVCVGEREVWLPNVRLVNGQTKIEARRALMLTFNTPFFPEILIASAVLSEGVDLHLNCRHIIHHDLCWNPSTIEQRTGRVDRIGAKVETCRLPIDIFLPYVAGTQDEKMYRVVMDRERWFKVVMGEELKTDSASVEKMADRIPLPEGLARRLSFNLAVEAA